MAHGNPAFPQGGHGHETVHPARFARRRVHLLPVAAQPFPAGPIHVVVPLAPGDTADTTARVLSEEIARLLNTSLQAINRPGAGGALGAKGVVQELWLQR